MVTNGDVVMIVRGGCQVTVGHMNCEPLTTCRPEWDSSTTAEELEQREREAFLTWRRGLARLQEDERLILTPFERNLEFWRQLWRVVERR